MDTSVIEAEYPLTFRKKDAYILGEHIKTRHPVSLVGMKRVGISNFLRFFLYHRDIQKTYIKDRKSHLFIPVDLNDLVELEVYPFWILTLKRIADFSQINNLDHQTQKEIQTFFLDSIQSQDLFLTIDSVRKSLIKLCQKGYLPTIFFIRFDRISQSGSKELLANLQGLADATHQKLSYVFTSVRNLDELDPEMFPKSAVSAFIRNVYIKPGTKIDTKIIYEHTSKKYIMNLTKHLEEALLELVDGYTQYLQFALVFMNENKGFITDKKALFDLLVQDERIVLQSEELWESFTKNEQSALLGIIQNKNASISSDSHYLMDTGVVNKKNEIFSPLFEFYLKEKYEEHKKNQKIELTKKEYFLLRLLEEHENEVCEREQIIDAVWPEVVGLGVSDWAIDRLIARVRDKLKKMKSPKTIVTVKTRGYKLITEQEE